MTAKFYPYILQFKRPAGTSRGVLHTKQTFILEIFDGEKEGIGECGLFRGLSYDDVPEYEQKLQWLCDNINEDAACLRHELIHFPSIWFGYEQAILNLKKGSDIYFKSEFTEGNSSIKTNGLIWMGDAKFMQDQIQEKLNKGFDCIKLKIGVDWPTEKEILKELRKKFPADQLELRVDANGGFSFEEARIVLQELAELEIHSIEQPMIAGSKFRDKSFGFRVSENDLGKKQPTTNNQQTTTISQQTIAELCADTPTPIALDEELIGVVDFEAKKELLDEIKPQYIILKPSLVGGIYGTDEWISLAEERHIGWWITSALESNIGLNAIAQYTFTKNPKIPQGLGTGGLFTNNFETKLYLEGDRLFYKK